MLQVYDRVLTTGSLPTLLVLTGIAFFLMVIYLFADAGRKRVLARAAERLSEAMAEPALRGGLRRHAQSSAETVQAVSNLNQVQQALAQGLPGVIFDLPFVPFFLIILFFVHPLLGAIGLVGAILLVGLAILQERITGEPLKQARAAEQGAQTELTQLVRQRGAVVGMGMADRASQRWFSLRNASMQQSLSAGVPSTFFGSGTRALRMLLQIAILGSGAFLATQGLVSSGAIIASSIVMGRGLAPIDQAVNSWRQLMSTRTAFDELSAWVEDEDMAERVEPTPMPRPEPRLRLEELSIGVPGADEPLLSTVDHHFDRGRIIALLGHSGSGKTSLLQTLAGAWPVRSGTARLGERDLIRWDSTDRGRHIGYLPQHVELLRGTVFENIARFTEASPEAVVEAAQLVGCHQLILGFPDGYDTKIGEGGAYLSAGQRQIVGLARAFFGNPALLLLDEPTAHLDTDLSAKLMQRFAEMSRLPTRERTTTAIVATHDLRLINAADDVMAIRDRKVGIMPRDSYLERVTQLRRTRKKQTTAPKPAAPSSAEGDADA